MKIPVKKINIGFDFTFKKCPTICPEITITIPTTNASIINSIDLGYKFALKTILDANITTLIAALLLYNYGSGPIKGFAVTLSIGIISSMFTALILTKLIVSLWVLKLKPNRIFL